MLRNTSVTRKGIITPFLVTQYSNVRNNDNSYSTAMSGSPFCAFLRFRISFRDPYVIIID